VVGSVIRDRILSRVLFPAPFRPITPSTSPGATVSDTSRRAQSASGSADASASSSARQRLTTQVNGLTNASASTLRRVTYRSRRPSRYSLPTPSTRIAESLIAQTTSAKRFSIRRK
jgi:hypothetical protein